MQNSSIQEYINKIPKAELHLHIEGTFEPELMFMIAKRNGIQIDFNSVEELRAAYNFNNLQEFLDIYYAGAKVLIQEQDFYDLTWAYLERANTDNVIHTEIMFDPQTHTERGISFDTVVNGIYSAMKDAEAKFGITSKLILSILRHLPETAAYDAYEIYYHHKDKIEVLGLDSSELGNPPSNFSDIYKRAFNHGLKLTAHAGEEGPPEYVWEALDILKVNRIDHGNRSLEDDKLVQRIVDEQIALTVCPLSNLKLKVVKDLKDHPLKTMLDKGIKATVNSDDPAYFGGYINENFIQTAEALNLSKEEIYKLSEKGTTVIFSTHRMEQVEEICDHIIL
ncbi:MAG: adenosine deaminase, partial [Melioribacteraceae bacterium]|nr:adenosine deaminase [Melioribacteraceae bacterium]